uniref:Uncharacterized protein n=1 Tax=Pinguiococcus pyrenoidosus TaxID=172671 RepID=A0A7R9UDF1_9STRA
MEGCRAPSNHPRTVPHLAHLTPGSLPHPALGNITEHVTMFDPGSLQESYSTSDSVLSSADSSSLPSIENRASSASSRGSSRLTGLPWDFQADWIDEEYSPNEARNARADGQVEDLAFSVAEKVLPGLKLSEDVRFPDLHQGYPLLDYHGLA